MPDESEERLFGWTLIIDIMIWSTACGSYTLYSIEDGWFWREPHEQFPGSDPEYWSGHGKLRISMGCFLLTDGSRAVLIDSGIGTGADIVGADAVGGQLQQALALIGIAPDDIDTVVHTHLHLDHCGGDLNDERNPAFPRADYRIHRTELDYWKGADHPMAEGVREIIGGLSGRIDPVDADTEVAYGLTVVETPGHTPGHISLAVAALGSAAFITGDVTHHPAQVENPEWSIPADGDSEKATESRKKVFARLVGTGHLMASGHYPRPGMGFVESLGSRRMFVEAAPIQVA